MPGLLDSLGQGLQAAGGILSPESFDDQQKERAATIQNLRQLQMAVMAAVQNGSAPPEALTKVGIPPGLFQASPQAQEAQQNLQSSQQGYQSDQDLRAALKAQTGGFKTSDDLYSVLQRVGFENLTGPLGMKMLSTAEQMRAREDAIAQRRDALKEKADEAQQRSEDRGLDRDQRAQAARESAALRMTLAQMAETNKENKGSKMGAREAVYTQRMILGANEAAGDLKNVASLPIASSTGVFGGRRQEGSLTSAGKEVLANTLSSQETQTYNVMATGFQRSLATIEAAGLMPSGSLTHQMDNVLLKEGDTNLTKMSKLAQIRQIVERGLGAAMDNPRVSDEEKKGIQKIFNDIKTSVPYTQQDIIKLQRAQEKNPKATITEVMKQSGASHPDDIQNILDKYK